MSMAAIMFNDEEPFEQSVYIPSTENSMLNLVKIGQVVLGWRWLNISRFYTCIAQGQRQMPSGGRGGGQNFDPNYNILLL